MRLYASKLEAFIPIDRTIPTMVNVTADTTSLRRRAFVHQGQREVLRSLNRNE